MIVEDRASVARQLARVLPTFDGIEVAGTFRTGQSAVDGATGCGPDVILLDLNLPDLDGIAVAKAVRARLPRVEILIFTVLEDDEKVLEAIRSGASGYLLKGASAERVVEAIREVHGGGSVIQPALARRLIKQFLPAQAGEASAGDRVSQPPPPLTDRELEILELIAKGLSNAEAARALGLSPGTVRTHLEHIYEKLEVSNRTEAVTQGIRRGLIEL
ncbi:MAG: response regulator transcription factor [Deltaproteobacteria bacterium]|nr:response regulator transcription factor [Deltaproteobacteria bacterium]